MGNTSQIDVGNGIGIQGAECMLTILQFHKKEIYIYWESNPKPEPSDTKTEILVMKLISVSILNHRRSLHMKVLDTLIFLQTCTYYKFRIMLLLSVFV